MYFRNFSIRIKEKAEEFGCTADLSYPVLAASEKQKVRRGRSMGIDSTSFLIANDSYLIYVGARSRMRVCRLDID